MSADKTQSLVKRIPRGYYFFGIFCVLFVGLMVSIEIINGRFWTSDLVVYFGASKDYFNAIKFFNSKKLTEMQNNCIKLIDGKGAERVAKQISLLRMINNE